MDGNTTLLKTVLADAITLGTQMSELNYSAPLHGPEASAVRTSLERLRTSTGAFLDAAGLASIDVDQVFPLYDEIQRRTEIRRNR